jgi:hypothetical protein
MSKLVRLSVVENATQKNVTGEKNWATVKKSSTYTIVEVTTGPRNNDEEWKQLKWSGDAGEPVQGKLNRRKLSIAATKKYHVEVTLGKEKDYVDIWILWATVEILTKHLRPNNAAPFDAGSRDNTDKLGAVTYKSLSSSVIDEKAGLFVDNMGASGKVAPVATLSPKGVGGVIQSGLSFRRDVWSHNWTDGNPTKQFNSNWTPDNSNPPYLKLKPDSNDKIYDLDAPDLRWGEKSSETYNNFRQWIEWNGEKCSDYSLWHWQARWLLNKDLSKQITLNKVGKGNITLPSKPQYPALKKP